MASPNLRFILPTLALPLLGLSACQAPQEPQSAEQSVRPGVNEPFLDASNDEIAKFVGIFEVESRDIYAARKGIIAALDIQPGMEVGDIGAGTGLFEPQLQDAVGADGTVYAVDLSAGMLALLRKRAEEENWEQVEVLGCSETDSGLAEDSVDMVFICDTYHHFEYPQTTLGSLMSAIRPGGTLAIVDFERIPGTSREWVLNHVRAGKQVTREEIEQAGFEYLREVPVEGLEENYLILFCRP